MNKQIAQEVLDRSKGLCEVCGSRGQHLHHIIKGKGKRRQLESPENVINLCWECHMGTRGVHGREGRELDLKLKLTLQEKYFNQGYTETEVRAKMGGRLYATDI